MLTKDKLTFDIIIAANKGNKQAIDAVITCFEPLIDTLCNCVTDIKNNVHTDSKYEIRNYITRSLIQSIFNINMSEFINDIKN